MPNKDRPRVRLLTNPTQTLPVGSCGTVLSRDSSGQNLIKWDNGEITLIEDFSDFEANLGYILEGYSLLTMDDVLWISFGNFESLVGIGDSEVIREILEQFCDYTRPLRNDKRVMGLLS